MGGEAEIAGDRSILRERAKGMKISHITLIALSINYLIDKKVKVSVDEVTELINDGTLFDILLTKSDEIRMAGLQLINSTYPEEKAELIEVLGRMSNAYGSEVFGVDDKSNGLLYINGMLNELLQETDFDVKFK